MKKFYLIFAGTIMMCFLSKYTAAQTETDTTFFTQMNYIFANVDKSKVPYGILRDFGMEFTNVENYSGNAPLADSNYADATAFWDVYQTLFSSRISTTASGFVSPVILDSLWYLQRQPGQIALSGLYFNYSRFKNNAANNFITISNNRLYDKYVGGVWQNPYQSEKAFMLSPPVNVYQGKSLQIILPANLWFTNNASGITSIQLDAGDGLGYRTLTVGQPLNINYPDTGLKQWSYKLTMSGGAILYSHSQIAIQTDYNDGTGSMRPMGTTEIFPPSPFIATKQYLGAAGKGYATIQYANSDHILRRPLIVAEGYDPGHITKPEDKFGENSLKNFLDDATDDPGSQLSPLLSGSTRQYDIIYVDWKNGTDFLQRNAYLLETIIQWVNANKVAVNGVIQPNVVLGQSMGGVIARYALKDMENTGLNHQTRLYISDDAPHQGANVPQGYQHLARHARSLYIKTGAGFVLTELIQFMRGGVSPLRALSLADQPASKQMLVNFVTGNNTIDNTVHTAWQTELKNMGYPSGFTGTPFRKIAISNGSECANPQVFGAGANLLTYQGKANTRVLSDIIGMFGFPIAGVLLNQPSLLLGVIPGRNDFNFDFSANAKADGVSNQVYKGKITYTKKILWLIPLAVNITNRSYNSNASTLPYDYFPGGNYNLLSSGFNLSSDENKYVLIKYNITASNQPTFNFVPTVSALDIGSNNVTLTKSDYLTRYIGSTPPVPPKNTPFQNFITAFNGSRINEQHISIERRNGDWLAAELNGMQPSANCAGLCDVTAINGNMVVCATASSYTIPNLPTGSIVTWSVLPANIVGGPNPIVGPQTTLEAIGSGTVTLTANITNSCGVPPIHKTVKVGFVDQSKLFFINQTPCAGFPLSFGAKYGTSGNCSLLTAEITDVDWEVSSPYSYQIVGNYSTLGCEDVNNSGRQINFSNQGSSYTVYIRIRAQNSCGWSDWSPYFPVSIQSCYGGWSFMSSPNPASSAIEITLDEQTVKSNKTMSIREIQVTDKLGNIVKQVKLGPAAKRAFVNISALKPDVYFIRVFNGEEWKTQSIIKQ